MCLLGVSTSIKDKLVQIYVGLCSYIKDALHVIMDGNIHTLHLFTALLLCCEQFVLTHILHAPPFQC